MAVYTVNGETYRTTTYDSKEDMAFWLDDLAFPPVRAHSTDAGLDLRSPHDVLVRANDSAIIDTGCHIDIPDGYAGMLISKSGLNTSHDITSTGLIDAHYTGSIKVKLYNHGNEDYLVHCGDKVSQLVIFQITYPNLIYREVTSDSERGENGFGSSGK